MAVLHLALLALALLVAWGPAGRSADADVVVDETGAPTGETTIIRKPAAPSRLLLKLRPGADVCLGCRLGLGQTLGAPVPGSRLDALNRRHGALRARPLVRAHARAGVPETPAARAGRQARLMARFPARAARAPHTAAPPDLTRSWVLEMRGQADLAAVAREYEADPAVEWCEPDRLVAASLVTNDPFLATQGSWGQPFDDLWGLKRLGAPLAWDTTRGAGVTVAIVDTGIDWTHPDLATRAWTNAAEVPGNAVDDDGNGYVDDVHGWDFADDDADPTDDNGHGTHVAGTVAAAGDNGLGVVGVAFEAQVMAVRGLGAGGFGSTSDLVEAIVYAVDNGADVINASWGGVGVSPAIGDAIASAHAAGVVFVTSAGNSNDDTSGYFPANDPNAVTVGATTSADARASFSNFGTKLDVVAPGGGDGPPPTQQPSRSILSVLSSNPQAAGNWPSTLRLTQAGAGYLRLSGTSMASPHAAGVAALALAADPTLSVEQVRQVLRTTADDLGVPGRDAETGDGLVSASGAVVAPPPLAAHIAAPTVGVHVGAVALDVEGSATGPGFESYTLEYRPAADPAGWLPIIGPVAAAVDGGLLGTWDVSGLADGVWVLRLAVDRPGERFTDFAEVTLSNVAVDTPAPLAALRTDAPVEIRGTAAGGGFTSYTVEYRRVAIDALDWRTDRITLAAAPGVPVRNDLLATLDVADLTEGDRFDFRLTVENSSGTHVKTRSGIAIDPTLRAGWPQSILNVPYRDYLTVADLDGDAIQEILVGSGTEVVVFEPDGTLRPGWPQSVVTPTSPLPITRGSPLVADVTGDATPEVVATNTDELFAWRPDGTLLPGFPAPLFACSSGNHWLRAGDLDADGKDEIICTGSPGIEAYRGDGTRHPGWSLDVDLFSPGRPPAVANVLGGPGVEAAWYRPRHGVTVRALTRGRIGLVQPDATLFAKDRRAAASPFPHVAMADLDGDGQLDMALLRERLDFHNRTRLSAWTAAGRRVPVRGSRPLRPDKGGNGLPSFADLDGDGHAEGYAYGRASAPEPTAFVDEIGQFLVFQDRRVRERKEAPTHRLFSWLQTAGIAIGDLDGDGVQELVAGVSGPGCGHAPCALQGLGFYPVRRAVAVQHLDGTLLSVFPKPVPQFVGTDGDPVSIVVSGFLDDPRYATPAIADLDADGLKEVIWVDPETLRIFVWNVAGTPGPLVADWPMYHHDARHSNVLPPSLP